MENIPRIIDTVRLPVAIPIHAYLRDHHVEGQAVLPAVKAMQVIGETIKRFRPDTGISVMTHGRFDKFLHIPSGTDQIAAFVDIDTYDNGDIGAPVADEKSSQKIFHDPDQGTRLRCIIPGTHPVLQTSRPIRFPACFQPSRGIVSRFLRRGFTGNWSPLDRLFTASRATFVISEQGVIARIGTPAAYASQSISESLGSPFPLDAAYHCACVWGQRYARMVAFPVGFEKRTIWHHTRPEDAYFCRILPVETHPDQLVFDLWIADENGVLFESSRGVCMKDVSAGRMKPPQWITSGSFIFCH